MLCCVIYGQRECGDTPRILIKSKCVISIQVHNTSFEFCNPFAKNGKACTVQRRKITLSPPCWSSGEAQLSPEITWPTRPADFRVRRPPASFWISTWIFLGICHLKNSPSIPPIWSCYIPADLWKGGRQLHFIPANTYADLVPSPTINVSREKIFFLQVNFLPKGIINVSSEPSDIRPLVVCCTQCTFQLTGLKLGSKSIFDAARWVLCSLTPTSTVRSCLCELNSCTVFKQKWIGCNIFRGHHMAMIRLFVACYSRLKGYKARGY